MRYLDSVQRSVIVEVLPPPAQNIGVDANGHLRPIYPGSSFSYMTKWYMTDPWVPR